ncbi:LANO_0D04852g1_1 [Lachancea nothofagi CBS 11611]|uniref:LANO_0D04852g1_1 n=1 Tax=Lachancea nothofagi CBS 11611 TaxID=1266666 RepID=A0A1G4JH95_9SACH|nr:LANO_0D04852g1_1 [Lachancea nothofagi CBS 11611]
MNFWYRLVVELGTKSEATEAREFWNGGKDILPESGKRETGRNQVTSQDWRTGEIELVNIHMTAIDGGLIEAGFVGSGIVHLFRSGQGRNLPESQEGLFRVPGDNTTIGVLFVPSYLTARDMLFSFLGETVINQASHFRIIRSSDDFILLIKFRTPEFAKRFKEQFDGHTFNKMDPGTCHVLQIQEIVFQDHLFPTSQSKGSVFPMRDPFTSHDKQEVELPTCPVCLERLDSEVTGLATIPCQHTFHCKCLNKWKDSRCPVCRYSELKVTKSSLMRQAARCSSCGSNENLWICLICGNIGCGRYNFKHGVQHFTDTGHFFAMEVATQRVWDYAGDNYVHRLVQNEVDGKLVEVGSSTSQDPYVKRNKEYHLEYVQVLLSQLESQREFYEIKLRQVSEEPQLERTSESLTSLRNLQQQVQDLKLSAGQSRIKAEQKMAKMQKQLEEEKLLSEALEENLVQLKKAKEDLQSHLQQNDAEKEDLQEQVKDLMFFLDSQEKLKDADENVKQGTLVMKAKKNSKKRK